MGSTARESTLLRFISTRPSSLWGYYWRSDFCQTDQSLSWELGTKSRAEQRCRSVDFWCEDDEILWSDDERRGLSGWWHDSQSVSTHSKSVAKVDRPTRRVSRSEAIFILPTIPQVSCQWTGNLIFYGYLISIFQWVRALPRVIDHIGPLQKCGDHLVWVATLFTLGKGIEYRYFYRCVRSLLVQKTEEEKW